MNALHALNIIFKHIKGILAIFVTVVTVVTVITICQKPTFEARSIVLVKMFKEDNSRPGMGADTNNLPRAVSQDEVVNAEIQILSSREVAEKVIQALNIEVMYPELCNVETPKAIRMEQALQTFAENLHVSGIKKSNVISVSFEHHNSEMAAKAVNVLIDVFKEKHLALHSDPQSSFIGSQLAAFQNKLKESERKLEEFQQNNKVFSIEEQRSLLLRQRTELDSAFKLASANKRENKSKAESLRRQMEYIKNNKERYTQSERDRIITEARSKLLELQLKEQDLRTKYTDSNKLIVDTQHELEIVRKFLRDQEEMIDGKVKTANPVYQSMETDLFRAEADLKTQTARAEALKAQLRELDREIAAIDSTATTIQDLKREIAVNEKNYLAYVERHEDAQVSEVMNRLKLSNISVIQKAVIPLKPIKPNKRVNILLGAAIGAILGLLYTYGVEKMTQTFTDSRSVERYLELPVLVTVPCKKE